MSVSVSMPQLGESVTEGTVTRWLKKEGERVEVDEPLLEVSTDKVDTEIPSPASGILRAIAVDEDETVAVGAQLAVIEDSETSDSAPAPPARPPRMPPRRRRPPPSPRQPNRSQPEPAPRRLRRLEPPPSYTPPCPRRADPGLRSAARLRPARRPTPSRPPTRSRRAHRASPPYAGPRPAQAPAAATQQAAQPYARGRAASPPRPG